MTLQYITLALEMTAAFLTLLYIGQLLLQALALHLRDINCHKVSSYNPDCPLPGRFSSKRNCDYTFPRWISKAC